MKRMFLPIFDDEPTELIKRFEGYQKGRAPGYFDIHDLSLLIEYYINVGLTDKAEDVLELGERLHPNNSMLKIKQAKIHLFDSNYYEVLNILNAINEPSEDYEVVLMRIESLLYLRKLEEAWALTKPILNTQDSEYDWVCLDVAQLYIDMFELAYAVEILEKGLKFNPHNIELLRHLGECHRESFSVSLAIDAFERVTKLDPYQSNIWVDLGELYTDDLKYEEALEAYEYAAAIKDDDNAFVFEVGVALLNLERYEEALEKLKIFIELNPTAWMAYNIIADIYVDLADYETAIKYYQSVLIVDAEDKKALNGISFTYLNLREYDKALAYAKKAIEVDPEDSEPWENIGDIYLETSEFDEAIKAYEEALIHYDMLPETSFKLAHIYMDKGVYDKALKYYKQAALYDADLDFIALFIAVASFKLENTDEAVNSLREAIQQNLDAADLFLEFCPDGRDILTQALI